MESKEWIAMKFLVKCLYAQLSIPKQDESQNIKIEDITWMQKLGKRKMKATNMTQYKYNKTHTSLFCS
jgi:hypothetical protein